MFLLLYIIYIYNMLMSTRRERFKRLWPKRLEKTLWHIQSIGKLSEKTNYIYRPEEIEAIKSQLNIALTETMLRFDTGLANNIEEETNDAPNKVLNTLLYRIEKAEKANKLLRDQINSIAIAKDVLEAEVLGLQDLIAKTSDRLSREINHVKSSGRLAIPKV